MSCNPGDLVGIPFPYSDLSTSKRRPVFMVTPPDRHGDFTGLAVTSVRPTGLSVEINEQAMLTGRLPKPGWIRCDKIFTLSRSNIAGQYGTLREDIVCEVMKVLCSTLGCG